MTTLSVDQIRRRWADTRLADGVAHDDVTFLLAEVDRLRDEQNSAANDLVMMAAELGWATDGRLATAVRHAQGVLDRRTEERDKLRHEVDMLACQVGIKIRRGEDIGF